MEIKKFKQTSKHFPKRCEKVVFHSGDGSSPRPKAKCRKTAKFEIGHYVYCRQHAGEIALIYLLHNK